MYLQKEKTFIFMGVLNYWQRELVGRCMVQDELFLENF